MKLFKWKNWMFNSNIAYKRLYQTDGISPEVTLYTTCLREWFFPYLSFVGYELLPVVRHVTIGGKGRPPPPQNQYCKGRKNAWTGAKISETATLPPFLSVVMKGAVEELNKRHGVFVCNDVICYQLHCIRPVQFLITSALLSKWAFSC